MLEIVGLIASSVTFALVCGLSYCTLVARPGSWLANDTLAMNTIVLIFHSSFIGGNSLVPLVQAIVVKGPQDVFVSSSIFAMGSLVILSCAAVLLLALMRASLRRDRESAQIASLSPQPVQHSFPQDRLAA